MDTGKLYNADSGEFIANISYQFQCVEPTNWWGEMTLVEYSRVGDGGGYVIEIEDGRRARVNLKKRVNRAVHSIPPRYTYHFRGTSPFDDGTDQEPAQE